MMHLTRQMAFELNHEKINIRVNAIAPGKHSLVSTMDPGKLTHIRQASSPAK
jgi:NAD(P)-dependent dehydrogenase (short-subunit alcohol dehydrogenase family)